MNNSRKVSQAPRRQEPQPPNKTLTEQEESRLLLLQHLRRLVSKDQKAAREALEMSQEQAPELFQIAQTQPASQWAQSLMNSDSMLSLMSRSPNQAKEMLTRSDLRSLLEMLP